MLAVSLATRGAAQCMCLNPSCSAPEDKQRDCGVPSVELPKRVMLLPPNIVSNKSEELHKLTET